MTTPHTAIVRDLDPGTRIVLDSGDEAVVDTKMRGLVWIEVEVVEPAREARSFTTADGKRVEIRARGERTKTVRFPLFDIAEVEVLS